MNTRERGIPVKIVPDNIVDSIVFLQFETEFNQKKIESEVVTFLNVTYSDNLFRPTPLRKKEVEGMNNPTADGYFYSDGIVKVLVDEDKLVINCLNGYPGWNDVFKNLVYGLIDVFHQEYVRFTKVGVRYISMLKNESLIDNLDGEIRFNNFKVFNGAIYNFSCGASDNQHSAQVNVRLTEKAKYEDGLASIVDIEVLSNTTNIAQKTAQEVCEHVEYCHIVEKDVFYRLLSDNYVDSHNPVWR